MPPDTRRGRPAKAASDISTGIKTGQSLDQAGDNAADPAPFQVLPALSAEDYDALRADVAGRGTGHRRRRRPRGPRSREHLGALDAEIAAAAGDPIRTALLVTGITAGMRQMEQEHAGDEELLAPVRAFILQPRLDALLAAGGAGAQAATPTCRDRPGADESTPCATPTCAASR